MRITERGAVVRVLGALVACAMAGCQSVTAPLPAGVADPNSTHNPAGAQASYEGAVLQFRTAFGGAADSFVPITGTLTDELRSSDFGLVSSFSQWNLVDSRVLPEYVGTGIDNITPNVIVNLYDNLQQTRGQAREARGMLEAYYPNAPHALAGHLYAIEGYADLLLADLFCSGIPLSTLDFGKDFTYQPGSTTDAVYQHAVTFFDSALALVADSDRILNMARVGKGRALVALRQYADAAAAVAQVPDAFQYAMGFNVAVGGSASAANVPNTNFAFQDFVPFQLATATLTMVDREGANGLPYESSGDPRSAWTSNGQNNSGYPLSRPLIYDTTGDSPIVLASGIEARLIQAEAALQSNSSSWLATLNALRTDGTNTTQPDSVNPSQTDTLWNAGTGGVSGLEPLADAGSEPTRVTMLFDERAYWLFLTGHRQGDLRRLMRDYGRPQGDVYPVGPYVGAYNAYGSDVTAPIPGTELASNPLFHGCFNRGA
jgi:starch-binding outer membrane protein, SusD/RagB family